MRKLLKVLSVIILIAFIVAALGLFVPSLLGVETIIVGNQVDTNMPVGTVVYGQHLPVEEFENGGTIVYTTDTCAYEYEVKSVDINEGEVVVHDNSNDSDTVIQTRKNLVKKVVAIPFIGYLYIATQSTAGLIALGCLAAAILLLFIFACIIDNKDDDFFENDDDEDDYFSGIASNMKKPHSVDTIPSGPSATSNTAAAAPAVQSAEPEFIPGLEVNPDEKFNTEPEVIIRTAEEEGDYFTDEAQPSTEKVKEQLAAADKAVKDSKAAETKSAPSEKAAPAGSDARADSAKAGQQSSAAAAAAPAFTEESEESIETADGSTEYDERDISTSELPDMEAALEAALSTTQLNRTQQMKPVQPVQETAAAENNEINEIEIAIPVKTIDEYLQEAYAAGDDPGIVKDETTGIQFIDFSDSFKK